MATKHTIAQRKYDELHRRNYGFRLHNELDADIIKRLSSVPSMQGYIKQLIRDDISNTCTDRETVTISFSNIAMSMLEEQSKEKGIPVPDLVAVIVNEQLIRTCSGVDSVPEKHTASVPKKTMSIDKLYCWLQDYADKNYDGSLYDVINALSSKLMGYEIDK